MKPYNKILSIIIPTYNMEALLPRCLDSLLIPEGLEKLEVWIVNDGSKDKSSEIGHQYEAKYPRVFNVIDKINGNYGSCINVALPRCTGMYVKILDADDYFDTINLQRFILDLTNLNVDLVLTDYHIFGEKNMLCTINDIPRNTIFTTSKLNTVDIWMHNIAYRTQLLKDIQYYQTEGISYTDNEWVLYPMFHIKRIIYYDYDVYQYFIGREGQTMNFKARCKNANHFYIIGKKMLESYINSAKKNLEEKRLCFITSHIMIHIKSLYNVFLIYNPITNKSLDKVIEIEKLLEAAQLDTYPIKVNCRLFRKNIDYVQLLRNRRYLTMKLFNSLSHSRLIEAFQRLKNKEYHIISH